MSEQKSYADEAALQETKEKDAPKLQPPMILGLGLALTIILVAGLFLPLRDRQTLNSWLGRALPEAQTLAAAIPEGLHFTDADYDDAGTAYVFYDYELQGDSPIPMRTEIGRIDLPEGVHKGTFVDARSLKGGVLFARRVTGGGVPQWQGVYINENGLGELEEYLLRDLDANAWYLMNVPETPDEPGEVAP